MNMDCFAAKCACALPPDMGNAKNKRRRANVSDIELLSC